MKVLVIAEHDNTILHLSTLSVITAANQLSKDVDVVVVGFNCDSIAQELSCYQGVSKIILLGSPNLKDLLAEDLDKALLEVVKNYDYILAPATTFGKNMLPRLAALNDSSMISDLIKIESSDTFIRPVYAGNALETVQLLEAKKFLTIRPTAFKEVEKTDSKVEIEKINVEFVKSTTKFLKLEATKSDRPELTHAKVVVSGGRGLQSGENFKILEALADKLNAAIGASRAAVDAGFVPNDYQVGQTGKIVAPDLYIAVGISGAIQHIAGIKDSKVIVAINKDPDAPIFQVADYGIVGDLFEIVPELTQSL